MSANCTITRFYNIVCDIIIFMKLVLDTDVIVAAMRSPSGASAEILRRVRAQQWRMGCSVSLFMEYEAICSRSAHLHAAGWSAQNLDVFMNALAAMIEPVQIHYLWRPQLRDPADEMVLEAAVNSGASALITFNKKHFFIASTLFNLAVLSPSELLRNTP